VSCPYLVSTRSAWSTGPSWLCSSHLFLPFFFLLLTFFSPVPSQHPLGLVSHFFLPFSSIFLPFSSFFLLVFTIRLPCPSQHPLDLFARALMAVFGDRGRLWAFRLLR
jgi:hypothetical protein